MAGIPSSSLTLLSPTGKNRAKLYLPCALWTSRNRAKKLSLPSRLSFRWMMTAFDRPDSPLPPLLPPPLPKVFLAIRFPPCRRRPTLTDSTAAALSRPTPPSAAEPRPLPLHPRGKPNCCNNNNITCSCSNNNRTCSCNNNSNNNNSDSRTRITLPV